MHIVPLGFQPGSNLLRIDLGFVSRIEFLLRDAREIGIFFIFGMVSSSSSSSKYRNGTSFSPLVE